MHHTLKLSSSMFVCTLLGACGGATPQPVTPDQGALAGELVDASGHPAPSWVTAPTAYRKDVDGLKVVCGEGSIGATANINMAQTAAAGRARTALARSLETKVVAMLKDYQSTTTGGEQFGSASNDEQHVQDASKQITQTTLSGTEINETWISSKSTLHSLVCLNVERFKGLVGGMKQLDEQIRAAVVERAEKAWDELDGTKPGSESAARPSGAAKAHAMAAGDEDDGSDSSGSDDSAPSDQSAQPSSDTPPPAPKFQIKTKSAVMGVRG